MSKSVPKYCLHKASGQAYLKVGGKRIYLGKHGTPESHRRYAEEIATWQNQQTEETANVSIKELTLLYLKRSEKHYRKDGKITSEVHCIRSALRTLNRLYKDEPADKLTPMMLAQVRSKMMEQGHCRKTINRNIGRIVRAWKWGVSQGLVKVATWQALTTLQGLQAGRCDAPESEAVKPVELADVEAVRPHIAGALWGAIQFQLMTAARPSEALQLRLGDIDRTGEVWIYRPGSHKTQHHGKGRLILCGPKAQAVILEHAESTDPDSYVFSKPDGSKYRRDSYGLAIRRACKRAGVTHWAPNQLRHTAATAIRKTADAETAGILLGHAGLDIVEIYAERDLAKAANVIQKIG